MTMFCLQGLQPLDENVRPHNYIVGQERYTTVQQEASIMDGMSFRLNVIDPEQLKAWRASLPAQATEAKLDAAPFALTAAAGAAPAAARSEEHTSELQSLAY